MSVEQAAGLFDVRFVTGRRVDGLAFVRPSGPPTLPPDLDGLVAEVAGLTGTVAPDAPVEPAVVELPPTSARAHGRGRS